ncbi:MAG: hypothetical protein KAH18_00970 [Psychromonas sp.]|nr:hypothetical protein [Psychromonas sp.]
MKLIDETAYTQRKRLIDLCLSYLGEISRSDLMDIFKMQPTATTRDVATYKKLALQDLARLNKTKSKTYHRTSEFTVLFKHKIDFIFHELSSDFGMPPPIKLPQTYVDQVNLACVRKNIFNCYAPDH